VNTLFEYYNQPEFEAFSVEEKFKQLLNSLAEQVSALGVHLVATTPETFKRFQSFKLEQKIQIYERLLIYYKICASAAQNNVDLYDDKHSLVWWAIRHLNLRPPSDFFQYLEKDDVVEIYDSECIQIFRSFSFFQLCIYPLDQLLTYEWPELYERDETITKSMIELAGNLINGNIQGVHFCNTPTHSVVQRSGNVETRVANTHRFVAPLKLSGSSRNYFLNVFRTSQISN